MRILKINLQLFADGAVSAGGAEGVSAVPTATTGVDSASSAEQAVPTANEDRQSQYAKFKEDFKAEYKADVEGIVKDRLKKSSKENSDLNAKLKALAPILEGNAKKYGVDASDFEALVKAYEDDEDNLRAEAYERDMSVEQLKTIKGIEKENRTLREQNEAHEQMLREQEAEQKRQEQFQKWNEEAEQLKQVYPQLNPSVELQDERFARLLGLGVDMRTCYEVTHKDEIMRGAMQYTADRTAEKIANSVIANGARPSENGLSSQAASISRLDINKLSRAEIEALKKRAASGESGIDLINKF
jgi:hypothetical protein